MTQQDKNNDFINRLLEKSNIDAEKTSGVGCPKCKYRGYHLKDNKAENCECWYKTTIKRLCMEANIPSGYIGMTLEDNWNIRMDTNNQDTGLDGPKKQKIKNCIAKYIKFIVPLCAGLSFKMTNGTSVSNLMLVGDSRSGKTLLASIIAQEAVKKGLITKFINWIDLEPIFSDFEAREEQNEIVEECKNADLLVIDGVQYLGLNNPYYLSGLERIASARLNKKQPTVISAFPDYIDIKGKNNQQ